MSQSAVVALSQLLFRHKKHILRVVRMGYYNLWLAMVVIGLIGEKVPGVWTTTRSAIQLDPNCDPVWKKIDDAHTMCIIGSVGQEVVLSQSMKDSIVQLHNRYRAAVYPPAADMAKTVWDEELALVAGVWARQCRVQHDINRNVPSMPTVNVGQNMGFGFHTWTDSVSFWFNERRFFVFGHGSVIVDNEVRDIGHYTQLVNSRVHRIGCAQAHCPSGYTREYVCNYAYGQTVINFPYKNDTASCSDCPDTCDDTGKLCDCGGKVCVQDGVLDINTCTCRCRYDLWGGENCSTLNCPPADKEQNCGPGRLYGPHVCQLSYGPYDCPYMCGVCPHACGDKLCYNGGLMNWATCQCTCRPGFEGENCSIPKCDGKVCENGGKIDWHTCQCACTEYYAGDTCQTRPCGNLTCYNEGKLDKSTCKCRCLPVWHGNENCTLKKCPDMDGPNCRPGTRYWNQCHEPAAYGAECPYYCQTCSHECGNQTCHGRGLMKYTVCTCQCQWPFFGEYCEHSPTQCPYPDLEGCGKLQFLMICDLNSIVNKHCPFYCGLCRNPCQPSDKTCENGGTLNTDTCSCVCPDHYVGDACQLASSGLENVAKDKHAEMTRKTHAYAEQAVDGRLDTFVVGSVPQGQIAPQTWWWFVDLGTVFLVQAVAVSSMGPENAYLTVNFVVGVFMVNPTDLDADSATTCYVYTGAMMADSTETLVCRSPKTGRFVKISQDSRRMQFREVQVLA